MNNTLKPCPFCNIPGTLTDHGHMGFEAHCCNRICGINPRATYSNKDLSIAAWNHRSNPKEAYLLQLLKEARDQLMNWHSSSTGRSHPSMQIVADINATLAGEKENL